jgi:catechol 1,2-dioxygenase
MAGRPVGVIMYDALGNMAVQITGDPRGVETPAEQPDIVNGYVAYYARYEVDSRARTVTHHRRGHVNPALADLSVVRYYEFSGDTLTLTVAPDRNLRLNWVRQR